MKAAGIFNTHGDVFGSGSAKHLHSQEANDTAIFLKTKWIATYSFEKTNVPTCFIGNLKELVLN
jgi:hypothetical protein